MTVNVLYSWENLTRYYIFTHICKLRSKLVNKELSIEKYHSILTHHLKNSFPLKFKKKKDYKVKSNEVWVGGMYYSDYDEQLKKSIEITLVYPGFEDTITIGANKFKRLAFNIADTLLHEIIHMHQYRNRQFKIIEDYNSTASKSDIREEQSYLGCPDEIDAYGFNIACELNDKFKGNTHLILQYLDKNQKGLNHKHNSWRMYLKAFQHDHQHPVIQKVKKKVVKYLPYAVVGNPFSQY